MKRIMNMFAQDFLLAYRNGHVLITVILLIGALLLIAFLPRSLKIHNELLLDTSTDLVLNAYLRQQGVAEEIIFTERAAFDQVLEKNPNKIGIIFSGGLEQPHFEFIVRSAVPEQNLRLLQASLDTAVADMRGDAAAAPVQVEYLRQQTGVIPFNLLPLPVLLIFEVVLLGFFIVAVMVFQEKSEGTLRAYRVTPGGTLSYILSKMLLFLVLSLIYGLIPVLFAFGLGVNFLPLLLLLGLSSSLMTMFSLGIASYYRNLTEWFFVGVALLLINSLPIISYGMPAFAPGWLTWLPSYHGVFAVRDVLFSDAGLAQISPTLLYLLALNLAALAFCYYAVRSQLMKGARA
jgi:hypothetical protein